MFEWFRLPKNPDEWRNFGCWITEKLTVDPISSYYLIDIRLGFKRHGVWCNYIQWPPWNLQPVSQNFWNGVFTFNIYVLYAKTKKRKIPLLIPRFNLVSRFTENRWFEMGLGYLFDRGEFGGKLNVQDSINEEKYNPGVNAKGYNEGPV